MESAPERDDPVFAGVERGQFQRVLIGLGSRVAEEQGIFRIARQFPDLLRKLLLERFADTVRIKAQLAKLLSDSLDIPRMAMPHGDDGMAPIKFKVLSPLVVPNSGAFRVDRRHIE